VFYSTFIEGKPERFPAADELSIFRHKECQGWPYDGKGEVGMYYIPVHHADRKVEVHARRNIERNHFRS